MPDSILLYQFMRAEYGLLAIENRRVRVSRVKELNDPFEWRLGVEGYIPEGEIVAEAATESVIEKLDSEFGVICFSATPNDPVLWSHYADHHRGIALEVDYENVPDRLIKMEYTLDRPVMDANWLNHSESFPQRVRPLVLQMLRQKAPGWAYEQEYRVHSELAKCDISGGNYFQRIPDDFLVRVILGARCELDESYLRKALEEVGLSRTEVVRAKMDQRSYQIMC